MERRIIERWLQCSAANVPEALSDVLMQCGTVKKITAQYEVAWNTRGSVLEREKASLTVRNTEMNISNLKHEWGRKRKDYSSGLKQYASWPLSQRGNLYSAGEDSSTLQASLYCNARLQRAVLVHIPTQLGLQWRKQIKLGRNVGSPWTKNGVNFI